LDNVLIGSEDPVTQQEILQKIDIRAVKGSDEGTAAAEQRAKLETVESGGGNGESEEGGSGII